MSRFALGCGMALMFAMGTVACDGGEPVDLARSKASQRLSDDDAKPDTKAAPKAGTKAGAASVDDGDDDDDGAANDASPTKAPGTSTSTSATPKSSTQGPPPAIQVTYAAAAAQKFGNVPIHRSCSDMGVDFNQASLADGTSLSLVNVADQKVLVKVDGAAFTALKNSVVNGTGEMNIPVDAKALPTSAGSAAEFALIAGGDSRFGSPGACGVSIAPKDEQDRGIKGGAGRFPTGRAIAFDRGIGGTGCGIIGFLQAYYDPAEGKVYARPTSPILIAADDEGRAGFPNGNNYKGCDAHASPLVLDLGEGVTLGPTRDQVFDIDGDGRRDALGWVTSNDTPFLVRDANGNGNVDGADELFGDHTPDLGGRRLSHNGFEALAGYDDVEDGVIDAKDRVWSSLRLWFDRDHDGRTSPGELETLDARGVRAIATGYVSVSQRLMSGGNLEGAIRQRGGATMSDGRVVPVVDVWFERRF